MRAAVLCSVVLLTSVAFGCGARNQLQTGAAGAGGDAGAGGSAGPCPPDQSIHFVRPADETSCIETSDASNLVFLDEPSWVAFWDEHVQCSDGAGHPAPAPAFDFDEVILIGVLLEGDCAYSGCENGTALITNIQRADCRLTVGTRIPAPDELGPCSACVQPRDFVKVDRELAGKLDEVVFE